jgi:hypothetical protein
VKKDVTHRIAFYTRKLSQYWSVHPAKKRPVAHTFRLERLKAYQKLMHEQIADKYPALAKKYMG